MPEEHGNKKSRDAEPHAEREEYAEHRTQTLIGNLLRAGVLTAAAVVLVGAVVYLIHYGSTEPQYDMFCGEPSELRSVGSIVLAALHLHGRALIQFGLLILIATPVFRVAALVVSFAFEHDLRYVFISLTVLGLLAYSLLAGSF